MNDTVKKAIEAFGDSTRYEILKLLRHEGPLSANEISVKINKHRATIDKHLKILSKVGFVARAVDEKRGVYVYMLTEAARSVLDEFNKAVKEGRSIKPYISIPIRRYKILKVINTVIKRLVYVPSIIFFSLGFIGFFAPVSTFLFRTIWLCIFLMLTWAWFFFARSLLRSR